MKRVSIILLSLFLSISAFSQKSYENIDLEDIVSYRYWARGVWGITSMADGMNYTVYDIDMVKRTVSINKYSYQNGDKIGEIVNLSNLGIGWVSTDYQFSNDETKLLLATDEESIYRHSFTANFWVYDIPTKKLTSVSDNGPQRIASFSPDGKKVVFMRDNNLYIKDLTTNEEKQITNDGEFNKIINGAPDWVYEEEFGYNKAYEWSPDGSDIAFVKFNESKVKEYTLVKYAGETPHFDENELYPGLYTYKYPKAGEDNSVVSVHIYNLASGKTIKADIGSNTDIYIPRIKWNVKGDYLGIERLNRDQNQIELLYADAATGSTKVVISEKNKYYISDDYYDNLQFLPDGEYIILTSERNGYSHLYLYDTEGNMIEQLTKGNFDVTAYYGFDSDKKVFYYQAAAVSPLQREVYSVKMNGKVEKISSQKGTNNAEFSNNFKYYINTFSSATTPKYVTLNTIKGKVVKVLEDNQAVVEAVKRFGGVNRTFLTFKTSDNVELYAYRIVPPDFDESKKYPVIVMQYSGPNSQTVSDSWQFDWENYLAQQGFVIIGVDTRGTGARGEEFRKVTYKQLGKYETIDLIETAKYLGTLSYVDAARIGIWGWSYGGFMVLNAMTKGNGIYNTGVSVAPVTNWRYYDNIYTERYMGKPQDNPDGYDKNSPLNYTDDFKGNLFLAFGTADDNVHPQNSYEFIEKMVQSDKDFTTFPFVNRNHGIYGGNTSLFLYRKKVNFFIEHLKP